MHTKTDLVHSKIFVHTKTIFVHTLTTLLKKEKLYFFNAKNNLKRLIIGKLLMFTRKVEFNKFH